ncbi:hypothetical protein CSUI_000378 [Cystoisospora suis]|uniref:EGF-like domain-containing protein n=1 Tax=Cystoisospora suis TaxID=483139 RepID=A0A2C6L161_9APIC|nr:hypothetical protein CSUI_000378 [Cystoisospora suis]
MSTSRSTGSSSTSKTWSELTDGQPDIRTGSNQNAHAGDTENVSVVETPTSSSLLSLGIFGVRTQPLKFRCTSVGEAHCNENDARFCICVASPHKAALSFSLQYQLGGGGLRPAAVRRRSRPEANHGSRASQRSGNAGGRGNAIHPLDPPDAARLPPSARGEQITEPTTKSTTPACLLSMLPVKLHLLFEDVSKVQSEGASQSAVGPDAELIPGGASSCSEGPGALLINSPDCSQPSHNGCGSPASKQGEHDNRESVRWLGAVPMNTGVTTEGHSAGKETLGCTENRWLEEVIAEVRELGYHESLYVTPHECLPAGLRTRVSAVRVQTRVSLLGDGQDFASHVDGEGWTVEHRVDLLHVAQGDILVTAVQQLSSFRSQDRVVRGTKFHHIPTTPEWQEPAVKGLQVSMEASTCSNREAVQSFERSVEELHLETETRRRAQPSPPLKKPTSWRDRGQKESPGVATRAAYLALRRDLGEEIQAGGYQELSLFGSSPTHGFLSQTPLYRLIQERLQRSAGGLHETATPRPTSLITGHAQRSCFTHSVGHGNDVTAANASEPDPARAVKTTERSIVASDEPATSPHLDESSFWSPGSNHTGRAQSEVAEGSSKKHSTNVRTGSVTADTNTTRSSKRPAQPFTQVVFQDSSSKHSWESLPGKCSPPFSARMAGRTLQQDLNSHLPPLHARRYAARKKSLPSGSTVVAINGGWSYGLAYLGRNDLCPATILRSTLVIPEAFLNPVTPLKVQVMLRRGAVPLAVEGALAHGSWRTSESPHASHQQDSTAAATSIQDAAGVKDHTSCSDFVADTAFEWTLTSLHLDKARQARGLLEVETPPLKHLKPGQYVVGWRVVVRQVKIAAVEDSQHPDTRANNHVGHFRRAASRRQDVWTDLQQTEYPEDPSDSTKASQSGKTAASDLPKRNTAASRGGSDGKQTGNWISSRPLWTLQVNQLLRLLGSISVSQGLEEQSMSHFRDRILNDRSQDPSQPAGESLDRVQADTLRGRVDPDQAAEAEVDTISSADSRGEVPQAHHSVYFCLRGACIQLFFSFRVADLCPLGCDNGSHCVAHPARGHWEYVCLCREGFMGDRCELKSLPDFASSAVMLSNLAIVPAVAWAAKIRDFLASAAFLFTGMASLFYHVCYSEHWCILPPHTLSVLDHAGSLSSFVCVAVRLMHFEKGRTRQRLLASLLLLVSALLFFQGGVTALGLGLLFSILGILFLSRITYVLLKSESRAGREAAELQNSLEGAVRDAFEQEIFNISVTHPCFLYEECLTEEDGKGEERGDESLEDSSSTLLSTAGSTSRGSTGFQSFGEPEAPCISEAEFVGDSSDSEPACSVLTHASSSVSRGSVFTTSRTGFFRERLQQGGTRLFSNEHGSGMKPASGCCVEDLPVPVPVTETGGVKRVARAVIPVPQRSRRGGIVVDICESPGKGKPSSASDTQDGDLGHSDVAGDDGSDGREPQRSTTGNEHSHLFWTGGAFEEIVPCRARSSTVNFTISAPRPYRRVVSSVQSGQPADSLEECGLGLRSATSPTENQVRDFFCTQTVHLERDRHVYRRHSAPQQPHFFQFPMAVAEVRNEVRGDGVDHDTESTTVGANKITVIVSGIIRNARLGHGLGNGDGVTLFSRLVPCIRSTARRVFKSSDVATTPRSPSTQEPYLPDEGFDTFVDALSWRGTAVAVTLQHYLVPSRPVFLLSGLAATGAAAACWQLATNETYWVIHAFWHLFIMLSPFLAYKVHEDKRSENPFPVYLNFQTEGRAQREI